MGKKGDGEATMASARPNEDWETRGVFVHEKAEVHGRRIGARTKIWQCSIVLAGARIGKNCNISAHCFIENDVAIGDNVTVKCGVYLWDGVEVEDDVFIGPNVTFTNDKYPRSKAHSFDLMRTVVRKGASIGAGSTILCGVTIGENALIGAGSVVTGDVPDGELWWGAPAVFRKKIEKMDC